MLRARDEVGARADQPLQRLSRVGQHGRVGTQSGHDEGDLLAPGRGHAEQVERRGAAVEGERDGVGHVERQAQVPREQVAAAEREHGEGSPVPRDARLGGERAGRRAEGAVAAGDQDEVGPGIDGLPGGACASVVGTRLEPADPAPPARGGRIVDEPAQQREVADPRGIRDDGVGDHTNGLGGPAQPAVGEQPGHRDGQPGHERSRHDVAHMVHVEEQPVGPDREHEHRPDDGEGQRASSGEASDDREDDDAESQRRQRGGVRGRVGGVGVEHAEPRRLGARAAHRRLE